MGAGFAALALGLAGIILPVLPTTPFVLLAAACFARSSVRFHDALLRQRTLGPIIHEWQTHRAIPRRAMRAAYLLMAASFGTSMLLIPALWHRILLASVASVLLYFLWRVPVREIDDADRRAPGATSS